MAKLHVVLDIDDTLQKFVRGADAIAAVRAQGIKVDEVMNKDGTSKNMGFALRPNLKAFMQYLYKNHEVSLWTLSEGDYAQGFAESITRDEGKSHPEWFKDIISADTEDLQDFGEKGVSGKNLKYLWDKGTGYTPGNTILIDDASYNVNSRTISNMIKIRPFGGHTETAENKSAIPKLDPSDTELLKIIEILKAISKNVGNEPLIPDAWRLCTTEFIPPTKGGRRTRKAKRTAYSTLRKTLAGAQRGK
jgi:hypothetical protein